MKKPLFCAACAITIASLTMLTACSDNNSNANTSNNTSAQQTSSSADNTSGDSGTSAPEGSSGNGSENNGDDDDDDSQPTPDSVLEAIRTAYGDSYLSNTPITAEMLKDTFGLTDKMYDDIATEMPMIGVHPDRLIVVKAKDGMADDVKAALETARESLVNAETMYPMNIAKVNSSQIVTNGNFVAYILAGAPDDREDASEDEMLTFAKEQTKIGVDAFNNCFKD